jgi:hypothetical protein
MQKALQKKRSQDLDLYKQFSSNQEFKEAFTSMIKKVLAKDASIFRQMNLDI